jgi:alkylated DNA repair dioxygenase AlkB
MDSPTTIIHIPKFIPDNECGPILLDLRDNVPWQYVHYFKRHVAHYGPEMAVPSARQIMNQVQTQFGRRVQGMFFNYYLNGDDYAPFHADKYGCDVVLLSFGVDRILRYKHNQSGQNTDFVLQTGDLIFIPDQVNNEYKHSLLKRIKVVEPRISVLVFLE